MADLGKVFVDEKKQNEGVWFDYDDDNRFRIGPSGSDKHRLARARLAKRLRPYVGQDQLVIEEEKVDMEALVEGCLFDWNILVNGERPPFSREAAVDLLRRAPSVKLWFVRRAAELEAFYVDDEEVDKKNSATTSANSSGGGRTPKAA